MTIQGERRHAATIAEGARRCARWPVAATHRARPAPVSKLMVGLQCGGSDGYSGITANPALGHASDLLVAMGGTTILSETPEIYGAEHLLTRRAVSPEVGEKLIDRIRWWEDYTARNGRRDGQQPLARQQARRADDHPGKVARRRGQGRHRAPGRRLRFAEADHHARLRLYGQPGYDPCSVTGQIASGATLIVFTTGRGSVSGYKPSPCIKLATNSEMYARMSEDMDINCGDILDRACRSIKGARSSRTGSSRRVGRRTKSEELGFGGAEFVPWQMGAVM
jgi:altronate dehydratase